MRGRLRSSIAYSALDSYIGLVLQVVSTVIVARILTPEQSGTFAVAAAFAAIASTFRDFGVAEYLIQEQQLDSTALRAALTINIAASWLMAAAMLAGSYVAESFYQSPGVGAVMRVQALSLALIPFGAVTLAWFRRELNFKYIFIASVLANLSSFTVVLVMALNGFGYMSLAWASFAGVFVTVATALVLRPRSVPITPGLIGLRRVLRFGKFATGIYLFGQLGKGAPDIVIGKVLDLASVGLFSRAGGLIEVFNRLVLKALTPVYLPYFAQSIRESGSPRAGVLTAFSYTAVIGWPFFALTAIVAEPLIELMYGPQWLEAAPLARVLCLSAATELVYGSVKEALLAAGKPEVANRLQMATQITRIAALLLAVHWGLEAACWGLALSALVGAAMAHHTLARHLEVRPGEALTCLAPSALLTCVVGAAMLATYTLLQTSGLHISAQLLVVAGLSMATWLVMLKVLRHPLSAEVSTLMGQLRRAIPWAGTRR